MTRTLIERNDNIVRSMNCRSIRESSYSAPELSGSAEAVCDMADVTFKRQRKAAPVSSSFALPLAAVITSLAGLFVR